MEIYNQLYSQLKHLVSTISSCNWIDYSTKQDIIQDVIIILHKKIEEGVLSKDFETIKGYSFLTLRNCCHQHHKKEIKRETPVSDFWELTDESTTEQDEEYAQYLHNIVKSRLSHNKYDEMNRIIGELLLKSYNDDKIEMETGLTKLEIRKHKFKIKNMLKFDYRRPVKVYVKNIHDKELNIPCYSFSDCKTYLSHIDQTQVTYMIKNPGVISPCGYYLEVLIKKKKRNGRSN
jgi:hypothetical protein